MAQLVKALATASTHLTLISKTYKVEEENQKQFCIIVKRYDINI